MTSTAQTPRPPFDDAAAWHALTPLLGRYLPWSAGAMRPGGLVTVLNEMWFRRPTLIVELGSGASTVLLARLVRELGTGHLLAVEHDEAWATRMHRQLDAEGLTDVARIVRAPLRQHDRSWDGCEWYDEAALFAALDAVRLDADSLEAVPLDARPLDARPLDARPLPARPIDVLVVDGPPAWEPGKHHARYPALGVLASRLAPGATIVLDDIERAGEQELLVRWHEEHGLEFEIRPAAGLAVAHWPGT